MKIAKSVVLLSVLLISILLPQNTFAASSTVYYPVEGTSKISAGIYKAVPNGTPSLVMKEKVYTLKETTKPPVKLKDTNFFLVNNQVAKASDYASYSVNSKPVQDVQAVGKDVYFTRFLFQAVYAGSCGGGGADILEIYKRASNGKISKVVSDKVSSDAENAFAVSGKYLYYAKVVDEAMGNFTIIKSTLDGKSKKTLQKGVDDFWIQGKYIYYIKNEKLYRMDTNGKYIKSFNTKTKLYGNSGCGEGNYSVSNNGMTISSYSDDSKYFFDFSKLSTTTLTSKVDGYILDVDLNKKRLIAMSFGDDDMDTYAVYDLKGKLIKKLKNLEWGHGPYSVNAKTGQFLYVEGSKLKQVKF